MPARTPYRPAEEEGEYWLLSLADLALLLLGFVVVLLSFSLVSGTRLEEVSRAMRGLIEGPEAASAAGPAPETGRSGTIRRRIGEELAGTAAEEGRGPPGAPAREPPPLDSLLEELRGFIAGRSLGQELHIERSPRGIELTATGGFLFESGEARLRPAAGPLLELVAAAMERFETRLLVEGHTDDLPIATERYPSNWELSSARAAAVVRALAERRVPPTAMAVIGYGDTRPLAFAADTDLETRRRLNRRAVLVFYR